MESNPRELDRGLTWFKICHVMRKCHPSTKRQSFVNPFWAGDTTPIHGRVLPHEKISDHRVA